MTNSRHIIESGHWARTSSCNQREEYMLQGRDPVRHRRKLSVSEHFEEFDAIEGNEDVRSALATLTGFDFIAATGPLVEG
jgi:hypothetical protein